MLSKYSSLFKEKPPEVFRPKQTTCNPALIKLQLQISTTHFIAVCFWFLEKLSSHYLKEFQQNQTAHNSESI